MQIDVDDIETMMMMVIVSSDDDDSGGDEMNIDLVQDAVGSPTLSSQALSSATSSLLLRFKSIAFAFSLKTSYQLSHLISMTNFSFLAYQVGQRHLLPLSVQRQLPLKASLSQ